jgi:hypothetical protein
MFAEMLHIWRECCIRETLLRVAEGASQKLRHLRAGHWVSKTSQTSVNEANPLTLVRFREPINKFLALKWYSRLQLLR